MKNDKRILSFARLFTIAFLSFRLTCFAGTQFSGLPESGFSELKSFWGVTFGESVNQSKYKRFTDTLSAAGKKPSDIRDYEAMRDLFTFEPAIPFLPFKGFLIKPNSVNGFVEELIAWNTYGNDAKSTERMTADIKKIKDYVVETYRQCNMELVTSDTNKELYSLFTKDPSQISCYYCFRNNLGIISQVITVCVVHENGKNNLKFQIETGLESLNLGATKEARAKAETQRRKEQEKVEEAERKKRSKEDKDLGWREEFKTRPEIDSFCGIKFGSVLKSYEIVSDLAWTHTNIKKSNLLDNGLRAEFLFVRCLTAEIKLPRPFRGIETARVYASGRTRRIFKIEIGAFDYMTDVAWAVVRRKFNPNSNPYISHGGLRNSHYLDWSICLKNAIILQITGEVGTGEFKPTVKEIGDYAIATTEELTKRTYTIQATHFESGEIAAREDSVDNDGADVL